MLIAIDGPSASGKSTVSRRVAAALGFTYVDSGALYRGITWKALADGLPETEPAAVIDLLGRMDLAFYADAHSIRFRIDGTDPGGKLRAEPVVKRVSDIAAIPEVRAYVGEKLRGLAGRGGVVMEGRDIGTVVFPATPFKFYLDADPEERARRRHQEMAVSGTEGGVGRVLDALQRRDRKDATRKAAPLRVAEGAHVINTTGMTIEEVVDRIVAEVRAAGVGGP